MEMWVDDLALSFEMDSGGRRLFVLLVLRWRVEGGAIC